MRIFNFGSPSKKIYYNEVTKIYSMDDGKENYHILAVDDEPSWNDLTSDFLGREGFEVDTETDPDQALEEIIEGSYDAVISDYDMPKMNGIELLENVRDKDFQMPFILFTGRGSEQVASKAISRGVTDYLKKQGGMETYEELAQIIETSIENTYNSMFEEVIGYMGLPDDMLEDTIENTNHPVLITNERGKIEYVNNAVEEASGYSREDLTGESPSILGLDCNEKDYNELWSSILEEDVWRGEIIYETKKGETYAIDQTIATIEFSDRTYVVAINKSKD